MRSELPRRLWFVTAAALVLAPGGCLDAIPDDTITPPGSGRVAGAITDLCQGRPLADVSVSSRQLLSGELGPAGPSTMTDGGGAFTLSGLAPGSWQIMLARKGFQTADKTVLVSGGATARLDLSLTPETKTLPKEARLDVLFVVDNSNSMQEEQQNLAQAFPSFMNALMGHGFSLDVQVGVVSTDMGAGAYALPSCEVAGGDGGVLQVPPGCKTRPAQRYIAIKGAGASLVTNVPGDMINDAFSCISRLGTGGCGFEQPLAAALKAIDGKTNPGFPRDDSVLAVIVVTDEDDCSATDDGLFDPSQTELDDPLGPLTSFRCFEFGVTCDVDDRTRAGPRSGCKPANSAYTLGVDSFVKQLTARGSQRVFFAAIAGPTAKVEVQLNGGNPTVSPSCQTATTRAMPAIRLESVAQRVTHGSFDNICLDDLGKTLANLANQIATRALLDPCNT